MFGRGSAAETGNEESEVVGRIQAGVPSLLVDAEQMRGRRDTGGKDEGWDDRDEPEGGQLYEPGTSRVPVT